MVNIDYIMDLFDWNNSEEEHRKGLELARTVECISVFIQPGSPYGKNVWENCAKVLYEKSDLELEPYLIELMEWLQDMNWPGAFIILRRLQKFQGHSLLSSYDICVKKAELLGDDAWAENLKMIVD